MNQKNESMELIPEYYFEFTCIADHCPITCCQEWKIGVDADTNRKWKKLQAPETVPEQKKNLSAYTVRKDGQRVIDLDSEHRCPFLNSEKLCCLVLSYGDYVLSETCTTFPREEHRFQAHTEKMLMPCCPAVIDLWKEKRELHFPEMPEVLLSFYSENTRKPRTDSPTSVSSALLFLLREKLLVLFSDSSKSVESELLDGFYILLELYRNQPLTGHILADYFSAETISQLEQAINDVPLSSLDLICECNELLQDLSVNYQKEGLYQDTLNPILTLAEKISEALSAGRSDYEEELLQKWTDFLQKLKGYEPLLRSFLRNEIFSDLILPGSDLESVLVQMQWIALEYATIRHSIFLKWMLDGCEVLDYVTVRDHLVIITRMTGYETPDIYEYLENSFESLLWDWGYFALLIGK